MLRVEIVKMHLLPASDAETKEVWYRASGKFHRGR